MPTILPLQNRPKQPLVFFNRVELNQIMAIYGMMVGKGEWRDYALDGGRDRAVFSIFRKTSEMPLYRIEKVPELARKQGQYQVLAPGGQILKRGRELKSVLKVFDRLRFDVIG